MKKGVFTYLHSYSRSPLKINRLIVSAFLFTNNLKQIRNEQLIPYLIKESDVDFKNLIEFLEINESFGFEELIELFEFVISPEEKIVNGAIYTPKYIREYITNQTFDEFENLEEIKICDPACGCAGFLYTVSKELKRRTNLTYYEIFENNIFGLDIEQFSIERSRLLLLLLAVSNDEDEVNFIFNFYRGNSLSFNWSENIELFNGFDIVLGNPPYVCSRNMDDESLALIDNWSVSKSGHPDLYIPFFQLGVELLSPNGILGYITVNTFFKSVNGRELREYFSTNSFNMAIIDFRGEQVFKGRSTYTCLCFIKQERGEGVNYLRKPSKDIFDVKTGDYYFIPYSSLDNFNGWNLIDKKETEEIINIIESTGIPFSKKYESRNGIATLRNKIFKFIPDSENEGYYFRRENDELIGIEKDICRAIINSNTVESEEILKENSEQIIFPYTYENNVRQVISETDFRINFPCAYQYLVKNKKELSLRDNGKREYESWFAFGRTQSLDIKGYKLFFPHISDSPNFIIARDRDLLFYNGLAVFSDNIEELQILKALLETDIFWLYISQTSKFYVSGHRSISKTYIKKFGIPEFTQDEKNYILNHNDKEDIKFLIESKYYNRIDKYENELSLENNTAIPI